MYSIEDLLYPKYNAIYDKHKKYIGYNEEDMKNNNIDLETQVEIIEEFDDADGYKCVSINIEI